MAKADVKTAQMNTFKATQVNLETEPLQVNAPGGEAHLF